MKYIELKIEVDTELVEPVVVALDEGGFSSMQIDDPADAVDIIEHQELYKYDYINEEISAGLDRRPVITLYFSDDEEGRGRLARAESIAKAIAAGREGASRALQATGREDIYKGTNSDGSEDGAGLEGNDVAIEGKIICKVSVTGDDSEWLYKWQENFKPTKVGERIVVKPSWEDYTPADDEIVIEMDPGMAFGSGLHETTSMCIKALEKILSDQGGCCKKESCEVKHSELEEEKQNSEINRAVNSISEDINDAEGTLTKKRIKVLDVGTGTGILSIAAALLGADECLGIDIDDEAVRVGAENVARNGLSDRIKIEMGDLVDGIDYRADIVVANLMADLVMKLAPAAFDHIKPGGVFISSGILDIKESIVSASVKDAGFEITEILEDGEWRAIVAVRKTGKS